MGKDFFEMLWAVVLTSGFTVLFMLIDSLSGLLCKIFPNIHDWCEYAEEEDYYNEYEGSYYDE